MDTKANSSSLSTVATTGDYDDLTDTPNLATVATSGSYSDLSNKPTIISHSDIYDDIILFADTVIESLQPYTTYNAKFDGTETLATSKGTVTASDGVLTATGTFYSHLTDYLINNDGLWEISLEVKGDTNYCSFILSEHGQTLNDKFELNFSANGYIYEFYNAGTAHSYNNGETFISNDYVPIMIKKTDYNVLEITVDDVTNTYTWNHLGNLFDLEFGVYSWSNSTLHVRNLSMRTLNHETIDYDTTIYNPSLDGTEDITVINSPCAVDTSDNSLAGATGYLTAGFTNTPHWKITLQAKYTNDNRYCSVSLFKKGITGASDIIQLIPALAVYAYTDSVATSSARTVTDEIGSTYTDVTIERINPMYMKITVDDTSVKAFWGGLTSYTDICIGIYRWNNASAMTIKDIMVKAPSSEV